MKLFNSFLIFCIAFNLSAQTGQTDNSIVKNIPFENIGPKVMSGRIVALEVNPLDSNGVLCSLCFRRNLAYPRQRN